MVYVISIQEQILVNKVAEIALLCNMVDPEGIEPSTSCLQGMCSPKIELWAHMCKTAVPV